MQHHELRHVPTQLLTPRLQLRCPAPGDGQALHAAIHDSLSELQPWMHWAQHPLDVEGYEVNLLRAASRFLVCEELRYLIFNRQGDTLLGSSGFHGLNWQIPKAEVGYWLDSRYVGQGYVTEAVAALTELAFDGLGMRRVEIRCDSTNTTSAAVPHRLGFTLEATLRNDDVAANDPTRLRDTLVFAKIR